MIINNFFKMAVLKCDDRQLMKLATLTPAKVERLIKNKRLDMLPLNIFGKVEDESNAVYERFLKPVMQEECDKILPGLSKYLGENHPLTKQITCLREKNNYAELEKILTNPDIYLSNITDAKEISILFCDFYNTLLYRIEPKYFKALVASIIDNI